jgi:threonine/homoserine/homoserine lactone efflux protein
LNTIIPFLSGFIAAAIGIFPPGLINMTAAKISVVDGKTRALMFTLGAVIIIFFQTLIALIFARYIDSHIEVLVLLREVGFVIFSILTIYFLWIAKKSENKIEDKIKIRSKKSRFFLGMFLSAINFFPIPYYVLVSVSLASFEYFSFETNAIYTFVSGAVFGSFLVFYAYIAFFKKIESKTDFIIKNMNTIIGSITGFVAISTLFYVIKFYFKT